MAGGIESVLVVCSSCTTARQCARSGVCERKRLLDMEQAELAEARAEIRRLREALAFYANPVIYRDWHDSGRRERRVEQAAQAAWNPVDGEYEGIEYRDVEVTHEVWVTTAEEDAGRRARAALGVEEPEAEDA